MSLHGMASTDTRADRICRKSCRYLRQVHQQRALMHNRDDLAKNTFMSRRPAFSAQTLRGLIRRRRKLVTVAMTMRMHAVEMSVTVMLSGRPMRVTAGMIVMPQPRNSMQHMSPARSKQDQAQAKPCGKTTD